MFSKQSVILGPSADSMNSLYTDGCMVELDDPLVTDYADRPCVALTQKIVGAAIEVHKALGPGLLETVYETCLVVELKKNDLCVEQQKSLPVEYKEIRLDCGYRLDLLVEGSVVVEVKSVSDLAKIYEAQLITYLKLSKCRVGLLINFNTRFLREGIRRIIV